MLKTVRKAVLVSRVDMAVLTDSGSLLSNILFQWLQLRQLHEIKKRRGIR